MKIFIYTAIFAYILCSISYASSFRSALDLDLHELEGVRGCVVKQNACDKIADTYSSGGFEAGKIFLLSCNQCVITPVFKPVWGSNDKSLVGLKGRAARDYSVLRECLAKKLDDGKCELIFSGAGWDGTYAVFLAKEFADKQSEKLRNQIKVITFSAHFVGDSHNLRSIHDSLSQENILQFISKSCFFRHNAVGICVEILPWEDLRLSREMLYSSLKNASLIIGLCGFYVDSVCSRLTQIGDHDALGTGLQRKILLHSLGLLSYAVMSIMEKPYIPSKGCLEVAFMSCRHNWQFRNHGYDSGVIANKQQALSYIGIVPWFSPQRNPVVRVLTKITGGY